jgi:hypothetical protein
MNTVSFPQISVLEVFQDINLFGPFRSVLFPASPICIVIKIVFSGTCPEDLIPGFGPGKLVTKFIHFFDIDLISLEILKKFKITDKYPYSK